MFIYLGLIEKNQFATFEQTELQNLSSLKSLYLDYCSLDEHSLQSLGALPSLKNLSLQELNGTVPSRGKLTNFNSTITYH
jgi:Leucine-rich repeat (LRR) protein